MSLVTYAQAAPVDDAEQSTEAETATVTVTSHASQKAAQQLLRSILAGWTSEQTARAAHRSMGPEDQQKVLNWMLEHQAVTITKFTKVYTLALATASLSLTMLPSSRVPVATFPPNACHLSLREALLAGPDLALSFQYGLDMQSASCVHSWKPASCAG